MVLSVEFLQLHAGHELLGGQASIHKLLLLLWVLLWVLGGWRVLLLVLLGVHMMLLSWVMLSIVHHVSRSHLMMAHLSSVHLSVHGCTHGLPLPHCTLHVGLPTSVVHHLAVGHGPHALLVSMLLVTRLQTTVHAHPVTVETATC